MAPLALSLWSHILNGILTVVIIGGVGSDAEGGQGHRGYFEGIYGQERAGDMHPARSIQTDDRRESARGVAVMEMLMPGITTYQEEDSDVCMARSLPDDERYIVRFEGVLSKASTVEQMMLFGCEEPGSDNPIWRRCYNPCRSSNSTTLFIWARHTSPTYLPEDVGFEIGIRSKISFLVLQVHYRLIASDDDLPDHSGLRITISPERPPYIAGIFILLVNELVIPAGKTKVHGDVSCVYTDEVELVPFGFRVHAHTLGQVIVGYQVNNGTWSLLGKGNPAWPQTFYPIEQRMVIKKSDHLVARCTYDSTSRSTDTMIGPTRQDEMCNFYFMYYTNSTTGRSSHSCSGNNVPELLSTIPVDSDSPLPPRPDGDRKHSRDKSLRSKSDDRIQKQYPDEHVTRLEPGGSKADSPSYDSIDYGARDNVKTSVDSDYGARDNIKIGGGGGVESGDMRRRKEYPPRKNYDYISAESSSRGGKGNFDEPLSRFQYEYPSFPDESADPNNADYVDNVMNQRSRFRRPQVDDGSIDKPGYEVGQGRNLHDTSYRRLDPDHVRQSSDRSGLDESGRPRSPIHHRFKSKFHEPMELGDVDETTRQKSNRTAAERMQTSPVGQPDSTASPLSNPGTTTGAKVESGPINPAVAARLNNGSPQQLNQQSSSESKVYVEKSVLREVIRENSPEVSDFGASLVIGALFVIPVLVIGTVSIFLKLRKNGKCRPFGQKSRNRRYTLVDVLTSSIQKQPNSGGGGKPKIKWNHEGDACTDELTHLQRSQNSCTDSDNEDYTTSVAVPASSSNHLKA